MSDDQPGERDGERCTRDGLRSGGDDDGRRRERDGLARRALLEVVGAGAALSIGGLAAGQDESTPSEPANETATAGEAETSTPGGEAAGAPPAIDPAFGYPGGPDDELPEDYEADATVELRTVTQTGAVLGDFAFDPVGLHVESGAVVRFEGSAPEHTVTAYHEAMGRTQRVPEETPPLSSPVLAEDGFWLYRFDEAGVYDLFCASHEFYGMVARVVVGDQEEWTVVRSEEGRAPFGSAQAVFDQDALGPAAIVEAGTVAWDELGFGGPAGEGTPESAENGTGTGANATGAGNETGFGGGNVTDDGGD